MGRYETFVIRLWIERSATVNHGEIRHPLSGAQRRFLLIDDALTFIESYVALEPELANSKATEPEVGR